jgi:hypothetical protein
MGPKRIPDFPSGFRCHEYIARGWNSSLGRWELPIYPTLDKIVREDTSHSRIVWNSHPLSGNGETVKPADSAAMSSASDDGNIPEVKPSESKGKARKVSEFGE